MGKKHKKAATVLNYGPYSTLCMAVAKLTHVEIFIFLNFKAINNTSSRYFLHLKLSHSTRGIRHQTKSQGEKLVAQFRWFSESHHTRHSGNYYHIFTYFCSVCGMHSEASHGVNQNVMQAKH